MEGKTFKTILSLPEQELLILRVPSLAGTSVSINIQQRYWKEENELLPSAKPWKGILSGAVKPVPTRKSSGLSEEMVSSWCLSPLTGVVSPWNQLGIFSLSRFDAPVTQFPEALLIGDAAGV